ncbi:MAG: SGNH/GDSL hydrolase family protein [Cellvibrio sp.]|uniref:SGNH/GDSL hydrolase family protein n=1 Tax=Cellvibrio sp. TaxID=1965322 RepID=UPI00319FE7A9
MRKNIFRNQSVFTIAVSTLALTLSATLISCQHISPSAQLTGLAFEQKPLANAQIRLIDTNGKRLQTTTDAEGRYQLALDGIKSPLLLSVVADGKPEDCVQNAKLRPICMAAIIEKVSDSKQQIGNINPLTDRIVSDVAVAQGYIGPQQWVNSGKVPSTIANQIDTARSEVRKGFAQALQLSGVSDLANFDPTTYPIAANDKITNIFSLIHHNRNYDSNSGETGHTTLTDISFRPITGLLPNGAYESFDLARAQQELQQIKTAYKRIFIVGDSTSAVYEQLRFPRMGWGQALAAQFKADSSVAVIVGSRAGRSSRDFYNGRWFAQMESLIQPGDYVFINHGHNDQNCDSIRELRGTADVKNLCTYPNNTEGQPQFPDDQQELSFQHSLERYIKITRQHKAIPILFTPTARIKNAQGQQATPIAHSHFISQNPQRRYLFVGDYTQTIRNTATANAVPLIDLEGASIQFANNLKGEDWKNYWLVVDQAVNSFYSNGVAGSTQAPDGTHFQQRGAEAMAGLVAKEIKNNAELKELGKLLK